MAIVFFLFFLLADASVGLESLGNDFRDNFSTFDTKRWIKVDRGFACLDRNCVYASEKNVQPMLGFLDMRLEKNCEGPKCCFAGVCTNYTGGMLLSKEDFLGGSVRFREEPVTNGFLEVVGQHCSGITSGPVYADESDIYIVAICHLHDTDDIILFSRFGKDVRRLEVNKFFRKKHQTIHIYRIDWKEESVEFFMNGVRVGLIDFDDHVPKRPMKIFVQMLSDGLDMWFSPEWATLDKNVLKAQTIVHRIKYIRNQPQDQSMTMDNDASNLFWWTLGSFSVIGVVLKMGALVISNSQGKKIELEGGYSELLGSQSCHVDSNLEVSS